jgi:hypothetical protein
MPAASEASVADRRRQHAAIDRERAGEDHARASPERPAGVEHHTGPVEIDAISEIGIGLGLPADYSWEVEYRGRRWG